MSLLNKISLAMAKVGCAGLRNASEGNKNNLKYVKAVIKNQGPRSFQFASDYIRSDAQSILELVKVNSEILRFTSEKIIDRFRVGAHTSKREVDYIIFAFKCLEKDVNSLLYFEKCLQKTVIQILKTENLVEGEFAGEYCELDLSNLKKDEYLEGVIEAIEMIEKEEVL